MRAWICVAMLAAAPAHAQNIDYPTLFEQNADQVIIDDEGDKLRRRLEMPGGVTLYSVGEGATARFAGFDQSGMMAVGCTAKLVIDLLRADTACESVFTPAERDQLTSLLDRVVAFSARNAVPRFDAPVERARIDTAIAADAGQCQANMVNSARLFGDQFLAEDTQAEIERSLATDRLPVSLPCL